MRNTKKFLAVLMAATMVLGVAACGDTKTSASNSVSSASETKTSVSSVEEKKEEPPAPLSISVILPSDKLHDEADANYDALVKAINEYTNMDVHYE
jgi:ABC-type glycerol-3-phosphate transport system substrate-binding protein